MFITTVLHYLGGRLGQRSNGGIFRLPVFPTLRLSVFRTFGLSDFRTLFVILLAACSAERQPEGVGKLKVSENGRYFTTEKGEPFFWMGDTGWLLLAKLDREETEQYLEDRRQKGFNVIQVMVLHTLPAVNAYGDSALIHRNVANPATTEGNDVHDSTQYDFWDHADYVIDKAAEKGLYMALVPVWGSNVKSGGVSEADAKRYATFLANRYKEKQNIIWLNGGDIKGSDSLNVWRTIGTTLRTLDQNHLITFHPRGRTQSSTWFHQERWLDFNMFQSGHRRYDQDTARAELRYGEDNWKYVTVDYAKSPVKPTLDGEPSYEMIPQGLHDTLQARWTDNDVRRYGYWSVFAGACGYTYGNNSVMQMLKPTDEKSAYGAKTPWRSALQDAGASQMIYLKNLMLAYPYFERIPDSTLVAGQGTKYDYIAATRGADYALLYTYTGRGFKVNMGKVRGESLKGLWYNPRDGSTTDIGTFENRGTLLFDPPGEGRDGNDWVLVLFSEEKG